MTILIFEQEIVGWLSYVFLLVLTLTTLLFQGESLFLQSLNKLS